MNMKTDYGAFGGRADIYLDSEASRVQGSHCAHEWIPFATAQNVALTPRENDFRSFFRCFCPLGVVVRFRAVLLKV